MIVKDFDVCFLPLISSHQLFANFYKKLAGSHIWGKKLIVVILIFKNLFSCWSSLSPSSQLDIVVVVCLHLFYLLSPHPCIVLVELNCYLLYIVLLRIFLTAILTGGSFLIGRLLQRLAALCSSRKGYCKLMFPLECILCIMIIGFILAIIIFFSLKSQMFWRHQIKCLLQSAQHGILIFQYQLWDVQIVWRVSLTDFFLILVFLVNKSFSTHW